MRFNLRTLLSIVTLVAVACTVAAVWLRRPVVVQSINGREIHLSDRAALLPCVMTNDAKSLRRLLLIDTYDLDRIGGGGGNWTLLQQAAHHGYVEMTTVLLEYGADPNRCFGSIPTPLQMAERIGKPELAKVLKEYGAK